MKTLSDITRGCKRKTHHQKSDKSADQKCTQCKKKVKTDDFFFKIGLRATTAHERFYSIKGCVWYTYCERCA